MSRAIVTGGASGIGASVVTQLRERGFDVVVLDRDESDGVVVDVTDAAGVDAAVQEAARRLLALEVSREARPSTAVSSWLMSSRQVTKAP